MASLGGPVEHYLIPATYPAGPMRGMQFALAAFVAAFNLAIYALFPKRHFHASRRAKSET